MISNEPNSCVATSFGSSATRPYMTTSGMSPQLSLPFSSASLGRIYQLIHTCNRILHGLPNSFSIIFWQGLGAFVDRLLPTSICGKKKIYIYIIILYIYIYIYLSMQKRLDGHTHTSNGLDTTYSTVRYCTVQYSTGAGGQTDRQTERERHISQHPWNLQPSSHYLLFLTNH